MDPSTADLSELSLYGLFALLEPAQDEDSKPAPKPDEETARAIKQEVQARLSGTTSEDDFVLELTGPERQKCKQYVQRQIDNAKDNPKKQEKLRELLAKVSSGAALRKEPRGIRQLAVEFGKLEKEYEQAAESLQKWRDGKLRLKNVAESEALVGQEREMKKELKKKREKLEKMRQTRQTFGAIDSDEDPTAKARQSGWTSTTRPLQLQQPSAVPNPAAAKGKTAPMKKKPASGSSAKNQWSANDLTLAQQLQMRMVHDIQSDMAAATSEESQEPQPEVAEAGTSTAGTSSSTGAVVAAEQASKGRAPAAAAGLSRKHSNADSDDEGFWEEMAVDENKFQTKAKQSSKSSAPLASASPSKQLNPAAEDEDDDEGNSDTEEPGASTSAQNDGTSKKKRNKANKSKRKTEAQEEEVALQKALAEANTEKTKSAAGSQGKKAAAFAREATKSGPSAVYALYKKVKVELETNSVMGEFIVAGAKPKKSSRGSAPAPGAADDEQALAELRSRLSLRNPLGLGQPEATSVAQYQHFFTKWTFAPPMAVPDKPQSTGLVASSSKKKAAAQGQQKLHLLVDPDLATRMRSTVSTFYPVLANVLFFFTVFWYLFLSSSAWVPPAASRARRNYSLAESIVQSASYIWAWGTTLLLVAQAVFSGVPEAGAALFGEDNKDLYVLALKILHGGVWGMLVFGVVILSSWSYLVGLGILVAGFLSAAKYEGTSEGGGRKEAED